MVVAVALGGSVVVVSEAAVSALLVVTIQPPSSGLSGARFLDSLLGGLIALAITSLLPTNPVRAARRAAALPLAQIAATLEDIARALDRVDQKLAERALARARAVERDAFDRAAGRGPRDVALAPFASATRAQFARYVRAQPQIDAAITSVETLRRAVVRALRLGDNVPAPMPEAIRDLSSAVRRLEEPLDDPSDEVSVREPALRAAAQATLVLELTGNLSANAIVMQVRAAGVDLLRGSGVTKRNPSASYARRPARWRELASWELGTGVRGPRMPVQPVWALSCEEAPCRSSIPSSRARRGRELRRGSRRGKVARTG